MANNTWSNERVTPNVTSECCVTEMDGASDHGCSRAALTHTLTCMCVCVCDSVRVHAHKLVRGMKGLHK